MELRALVGSIKRNTKPILADKSLNPMDYEKIISKDSISGSKHMSSPRFSKMTNNI